MDTQQPHVDHPAVALVDAAARGTVIVFGSLPPAGRDLDLIATADDVTRIERALSGAGYVRSGSVWARFTSCRVTVVDLHCDTAWHLPAAERARLYAESRPLAASTRLALPSPHHVLLLLADRGDTTLDPRRRARAARAVQRAPTAWQEAGRRAAAWGLQTELRALQRRFDDLSAGASRQVDPTGVQPRDVPRLIVRGLRRPRVIALSGLDGSGKSTQADALRHSLEQLGWTAVVHWSRVAYDPTLDRVAAPVKALLRGVRQRSTHSGGEGAGLAGGPGQGDENGRSPRTPVDAAPPARRGSRGAGGVVELAWAVVTALVDVGARQRAVRRHAAGGRVVICDRYVLDTWVHLDHRFDGRPLRVARWLTKRLSPKPLRAYLLDVEASAARARKPQEWDVEALRGHAAVYRAHHARVGVRRLDGSRPVDQLCGDIASDVWLALER